MRFQVSQSTPSYLSRRFQLRMLSFVGLTSVVMITLTVINIRNRSGDNEAQPRASVSPDSLTFEVDRGPSLKPDEILVVSGDEGIRGQFPDAADDNSRELFKSRKQERSGDDRLFPKRTHAPNAQTDNAMRPDDSITDQAKPGSGGWVNRRDRELPPKSAPLDDGWDSQDVVAPRNRDRDLVDVPVGNPLRDEVPAGRRDGNGSVPNLEFDDGPLNRPDRSNRDRSRLNDELPPNDNPVRSPRNPYRDSVPTIGFDTGRDPLDTNTDRNPVDRRRHYQDPYDDREPFQEDFATVRIDKTYLDVVKDNTLGITRDESEVFYWLLDHARRVSSSSLERAGNNEVQYINLMTEPDRYRGEPITIEGDLWRLYEFDAGRNDYGINRMYEAWVFTGDSGNHPYRVVCTSLPKGIVPGENLRKPVRITGYFFKREGYASAGGVHVAPALIARRLAINPMPNGIPLAGGVVPYMVGAMMAVGLALLVTIVGFAISDERSTQASMQRGRHLPHVAFAELAIPASVPIEETLRQLAAHQREVTVSGAYGPLLNRQTARQHAVHDYAASRQLLVDEKLNQQQRQTNALQDWAARQAARQAELDSMRAAQDGGPRSQVAEADELGSSKLEPARNAVQKVAEPIERVEPTPVVSPTILTSPMYSPATISPVPGAHLMIPAIPVMVASPHQVMSGLNAFATPVVPPSNVSYRASKLSEWEEEVAKMSNRMGARQVSGQIESTSTAEQIAVEQIERDRTAREQEIRDKIHRQQAESERHRHEQLERERLEHERDRQHHERSHRDHDEGMTFTLSSAKAELERREQELHDREQLESEHLERERRERERFERELRQHQADQHPSSDHESSDDNEYDEVHDSYQSNRDDDDRSSSDNEHRSDGGQSDRADRAGRFQGKSGSQSGWGRSRKRRRNWRDGGTN